MTAEYIAGVGMTTFTRHPESTLVGLATQAASEALADADMTADDVDALYVGNFLGQSLHRQGILATLIGQALGVTDAPATAVEGACASGSIALRHGVLACRAGAARVALCLGVEHLTGRPGADVNAGLNEALDSGDRAAGMSFPEFFAAAARAHAQRYGTTREQLSAVAVKNRGHGEHNPRAMFQAAVSPEMVLSSRVVAEPLHLLDCTPISDGAAAAVVTRGRPPAGPGGEPVRVLSCEQASGPATVDQPGDLTTFPAARAAARRAYGAAGLRPAELDLVELHDCFTISEIIATEDLGLVDEGEAGPAIAAGATTYGSASAAVVNASGGLLSKGHPVGATGLGQIHELVMQLRGSASMQVEGAQHGLAHNIGGTGATAAVTILGRD